MIVHLISPFFIPSKLTLCRLLIKLEQNSQTWQQCEVVRQQSNLQQSQPEFNQSLDIPGLGNYFETNLSLGDSLFPESFSSTLEAYGANSLTRDRTIYPESSSLQLSQYDQSESTQEDAKEVQCQWVDIYKHYDKPKSCDRWFSDINELVSHLMTDHMKGQNIMDHTCYWKDCERQGKSFTITTAS